MSDKKISQLNDRPVLAGTDIFPVVATGSFETNKANLNALKNFVFPVVTGNNGKFLSTDGSSIFWDSVAGTTPDLQEVTTNGAITTNSIFIVDNITSPDLSISHFNTGEILVQQGSTDRATSIVPSGLKIQRNNQQTEIFGNATMSADREIYFPDADGTVVVSVNGNVPDNFGNVVVSTGATNLNGLSDVTITTPANDEVLVFDSTLNQWKNVSIPGTSIPTLQEVIDAGNESTTIPILSNGVKFREQNNPTTIFSTAATDGALECDWTTGSLTTYKLFGIDTDGGLSLYPQTNQFGVRIAPLSSINSFKSYRLPNISVQNKVFAFSVNGIDADSTGNVVVPTGATNLDGLSDVTIATPLNNEVLIFDSTLNQWKNGTISGGSSTLQQVTDNGNTTTNDIVLQDAAITGIDFLDFDLTPSTTTNQEGRVQWNDDLKTIQIDTENAGVQLNVGHETIQRVRNVSGSTIQKGKIVFINGASGNRPTIQLSDYSTDSTSAQTIGFVASDIVNNANGYVITNGLLENINTTGIAAGTQLFLSSNGDFQTTFPTQPLHNVRVGIVIDGNSPNGSIFVNILNGYELEELHDCLISTPANDEVLTYETASGLWKNKPVPAELPAQTGNNGKFLFTNGTSASWSFPSRSFKLGFNNISDYVVNNGSGIQNFGSGTLGMFIAFDLVSALYAISGSDLVFKIRVVTHEQFGGVSNQIGVRAIYSSSAGQFATNVTSQGNYVPQTGTNFAVQHVDLTINIPQTYLGQTTNFFKFEVIMSRSGSAGSTSVIGSTLVFSV